MAKKRPLKNFTEDEVAQAESDLYIIQIGYELFYEGNYCAFTKLKTDKFYEFIRAGLDDLIKNGTEAEKREALASCYNFRIIPLRIQ